MDIKKLELEYTAEGGLNSFVFDGMRHVKVLPYLSVVQAVKGNYDIALEDGPVYNTGDSGFFVAPANVQQVIIHNADETNQQMVCRWIFLKLKINDVHYLEDLYSFPVLLPDDVKAEMHAIFDHLFAAQTTFSKYADYYRVVELLSTIAKEKQHHLPADLESALAYIKKHYKQKITLEDIAKRTNLSQSRFFSVFRKQMGISPIAYLNNYRLSLAAQMLSETDKTITEIANAVGINDSIYFNKMFRKAYQMSPTEYRKTYRA